MISGVIVQRFQEAGIAAAEDRAEVLGKYMQELLRYNEHVNLTSITDEEEFILKHYVDSVMCMKMPEFKEADTVIDVGTGGGFPGIPLAVLSPEKSFTLMDSLNKRVRIVDEIAKNLGIGNVNVIHNRAEIAGQDPEYREQFDLCVSRAVADLSVLSEYCLPLVRQGGSFVAYKGPDADREISNSGKAVSVLGGEIHRVEKVRTSGFEHSLIIIRKKKENTEEVSEKSRNPFKNAC
jgi:16S rRNA (guanine527-N7)-methyltransferase